MSCLRDVETWRKQRNRIVHSAYIHLEGGDQLRGIIRSDMSKAADGPDVDFHQELLMPHSFDVVLHDMALAAFGRSQSKLQLIHWLP